VLVDDPTATAPGAYPLTTLTYAAIKPLSLDAEARSEYATFIEYAAGPGQVPGDAVGLLPKGYVPLTPQLVEQTLTAANLVRTLTAPAVTTTTEPAAATTTTTASLPPSSSVAPATPSGASTSGNGSGGAVSTPTARPPSSGGGTGVPTSSVTESTIAEAVSTDETASTATIAAETTAEPDAPASSSPSVLTPIVDLARSRYAVPGLGAMALISALGALEITKRPRRRMAGADVMAGADAAAGEIEEN
jgi:hypothetical protein